MENIIQPDFDEISSKINEINNLNLKIISIDELKEHLRFLIKGYEITTPIIQENTILFRGVIYADKPKNIRQLTYPPPEKVTSLQRANRDNQPLFYCSIGAAGVPLSELGVKSGDFIVLSSWCVKSKLFVNNVGYSSDLMNKRYQQNNWGKNDNNKVNVVIKDFFANEFTQIVSKNHEYLYKMSIAIAELHFGKEKDFFNGILYPSIALNSKSENLVLTPKTVDNHLFIKDVNYILVKEQIEEHKYNFTVLDWTNSFTNNGEIEWKGRPPQWKLKNPGDTLILHSENSFWVARNECGEIVEPE